MTENALFASHFKSLPILLKTHARTMTASCCKVCAVPDCDIYALEVFLDFACVLAENHHAGVAWERVVRALWVSAVNDAFAAAFFGWDCAVFDIFLCNNHILFPLFVHVVYVFYYTHFAQKCKQFLIFLRCLSQNHEFSNCSKTSSISSYFASKILDVIFDSFEDSSSFSVLDMTLFSFLIAFSKSSQASLRSF